MKSIWRRNFLQEVKLSSATGISAKSFIGLSVFKYYIHDSVEALRFQLLGDFQERNVAELNGCWNTAKTILGTRKLIVDVRLLNSIDESGKEWLLLMAREGATYLPETYFRTGLSGQNSSRGRGNGRSIGILSRVTALLRGSRTLPADSSTLAP